MNKERQANDLSKEKEMENEEKLEEEVLEETAEESAEQTSEETAYAEAETAQEDVFRLVTDVIARYRLTDSSLNGYESGNRK